MGRTLTEYPMTRMAAMLSKFVGGPAEAGIWP